MFFNVQSRHVSRYTLWATINTKFLKNVDLIDPTTTQNNFVTLFLYF